MESVKTKSDTEIAARAMALDLNLLSRQPFEKSLPAIAAVYFAFSGNKLVYIGQTSNLQRRWHGTRHPVFYYDGRLRRPIIAYLPEGDPLIRLALEYALVILHRPKFNKVIRLSQSGPIARKWEAMVSR